MSGPTGSAASSVILPPKGLHAADLKISTTSANFPGNAGNGDYFEISSSWSYNAALTYFNNAKVSQWILTPSASGSQTYWLGIYYDSVDDVLYTLTGLSTAATLGSVNIATGVWTQIGAGLTGLTSITTQWSTTVTGAVYPKSFYRDVDGAGDFILRGGLLKGINEMIVPASGTGAVTESLDKTILSGSKASLHQATTVRMTYKSADGVYCGSVILPSTTEGVGPLMPIARTGYMRVPVPDEIPALSSTPASESFQFTAWGGDKVIMTCLGSGMAASPDLTRQATHIFDRTDFDRWLKEVAIAYGVF